MIILYIFVPILLLLCLTKLTIAYMFKSLNENSTNDIVALDDVQINEDELESAKEFLSDCNYDDKIIDLDNKKILDLYDYLKSLILIRHVVDIVCDKLRINLLNAHREELSRIIARNIRQENLTILGKIIFYHITKKIINICKEKIDQQLKDTCSDQLDHTRHNKVE